MSLKEEGTFSAMLTEAAAACQSARCVACGVLVWRANNLATVSRVSISPSDLSLRMRFGIGINKDHTLEEVGQRFSVTRERIRQIEAKALRKLKHPSRSRILRSFLHD